MSKQLTQATFGPVATRMAQLGYEEKAVKKEIGFALQIINANSYLAKADVSTMCAAILHAANTGLTLNPSMKRAALVPRYQKGLGVVCCFEPMYQGLIYLAVKEGSATSFNAQIVHQADRFKAQPHDSNCPVIHEFDGFERGVPQGLYVVATLLDGTKQAEFMSMDEVRKIMERSEAYSSYKAKKISSTPWVSDFLEMAKKTIIKRIVKRLPAGKADSNLYKVIDLDNSQYTIEPNESLLPEKPKDEFAEVQTELRAALIKLEPEEAEGFRNMLNEKRDAGELTVEIMQNVLTELKAPVNA